MEMHTKRGRRTRQEIMADPYHCVVCGWQGTHGERIWVKRRGSGNSGYVCPQCHGVDPQAGFAVEVQPPAHVVEMVMLTMEGEFSPNELRFVIYNDTAKDEWLKGQAQLAPDAQDDTEYRAAVADWHAARDAWDEETKEDK